MVSLIFTAQPTTLPVHDGVTIDFKRGKEMMAFVGG